MLVIRNCTVRENAGHSRIDEGMKEMKNAWFWFLPPLSSVHFTAAAAFMVLCSLHSDLTNQWTLANYSDIFSNKYYTGLC